MTYKIEMMLVLVCIEIERSHFLLNALIYPNNSLTTTMIKLKTDTAIDEELVTTCIKKNSLVKTQPKQKANHELTQEQVKEMVFMSPKKF